MNNKIINPRNEFTSIGVVPTPDPYLHFCIPEARRLCLDYYLLTTLGLYEPRHMISNNVAFDKCRLRRACAVSV